MTCDLDIYYQKGLLDYHIKQLHKSGILSKAEMGYSLTGLGRIVARFLESIENEYRAFLIVEEARRGGETVELNIEELREKDASEISEAKYGDRREASSEALWACGKKVPLKDMGWEWGRTISPIARSNGRVIGVLYGNTVPMHVVIEAGEQYSVVQPTTEKPVNRLEGEIYDIWVHPDYEGRGVERRLIEGFLDAMKKLGAVTVLAERVLTENKVLLRALEELGFRRLASY